MFDWNDAKYLLAVSRASSTLGAAKALGVNQTTVARRIDALERAFGLPLFERRSDGYRLTEQARELLPLAEALERDAGRVADRASALKREGTGTVRVTTTEVLAIEVLAPLIAELRQTQPGLNVELLAEDRKLDPLSGEIDVAIRIGPEPTSPALVRRHLGQTVWSIFCARSYDELHGVPRTPQELDRHAIIGGSGGMGHMEMLEELRSMAPKARIAVRCNSVPNLIASVRSGVGVGPLPYITAVDDPTLIRCLSPEYDRAWDIWVIYPETLRRSAPLRAFVDALTARFEAIRDRLAGRGPTRFST